MELTPETKAKLRALGDRRKNKVQKFIDVYREYLIEHSGRVVLSTALDSKSIVAEYSNFSFAGIISDSCDEMYIFISADKFGHLAIANYLGKKDDIPGFIKFRVKASGTITIDSYVDKHGNRASLGQAEEKFFKDAITEKLLKKLYEMAPTELISPRWSYIFDGEKFVEVHDESESMRCVIIRTIARENGFDDFGLHSMDMEECFDFEEMESEFY